MPLFECEVNEEWSDGRTNNQNDTCVEAWDTVGCKEGSTDHHAEDGKFHSPPLSRVVGFHVSNLCEGIVTELYQRLACHWVNREQFFIHFWNISLHYAALHLPLTWAFEIEKQIMRHFFIRLAFPLNLIDDGIWSQHYQRIVCLIEQNVNTKASSIIWI